MDLNYTRSYDGLNVSDMIADSIDANGWEMWTPERSRPRGEEPLVIIGRGRQIRLTPAAVQMLGNPSHIIFEFDRLGQRVALRRAGPGLRHAFQLRRYAGATLSTVAAESFLRWSGIDYSERRELRPELITSDTIMVHIGDSNDASGPFEEFRLKGPLLAHQMPNVSISRSGHITLNNAAKELIPSAERVIFLYNADKQLIGFRPSNDEALSRPLRKTKGQNTWSLAGEGFLKRYNVEHRDGRSYEPYLEVDLLVIDVTSPKPGRQRKKGGEHDERE
jgi:hypothetical protein